MRRAKRVINRWLRLWGFAPLLLACAGAPRVPDACDTSDLDAAYFDALIKMCLDRPRNAPVSECPGALEIGHEYQEKVAQRLLECSKN